jgi:hypothetical protein
METQPRERSRDLSQDQAGNQVGAQAGAHAEARAADGAGAAAGTSGRAMAPIPHGWRERLGELVGRLCAPPIYAIARLRDARMFHPEGYTFAGHAVALPGPLGSIGAQLEGRVLARCSPALSRTGREWLDVLGIALRFRRGGGPPLDHCPALGDQDLLFATVPSPLVLLLSPFFTDASDFVGSRYWATAPFTVHEHGRVELRLTPLTRAHLPGSREQRLREAVAAGCAAWWLEARRTLTPTWYRVAQIELDHSVEVDQRALRFDPFRAGLGLVPMGFVHAIRRGAYSASQRAR